MTPQLSCIGIVVSAMGRCLDFYRALGFDVPADANSDSPHVEVPLTGGLRLLIDTEDVLRSFDPGWTPPTGSPRSALAMECADPAEVDATYAAMLAAGFDGHLPPWDAFWGQRYATLRDPSGNGMDLFAPLT